MNTSVEKFKSIRGAGGAVFYDCDVNTLDCAVDISESTFSDNYADIKGGALHWDTLEPLFD